MVTQLQPDVRAYLHGGEVIKRYIRVEEVAHEYGFSVEETEYIAKAASSLYKLTRIHLVKKERFDEFMKHIYKVPGTNKQIIKKFARIGEASIIYSIGSAICSSISLMGVFVSVVPLFVYECTGLIQTAVLARLQYSFSGRYAVRTGIYIDNM